jgi:hypothetical protein
VLLGLTAFTNFDRTAQITMVQGTLQHGVKAHSVGKGTALPIHNLGDRRGWVVNATPRPLCPWERDPVPIVQQFA